VSRENNGEEMRMAEVLEGAHGVNVVGESFYVKGIAAALADQGNECLAELVPEPDNPYDCNAIAVVISGHTVGHLSREHAEVLCHRITARTKATGACVVRARIGGSQNRWGVRIWLPTPDEIWSSQSMQQRHLRAVPPA
jgi:hypothetical protein